MAHVMLNTRGELDKYTSVGCYPLFYMTVTCDALCADCANAGHVGCTTTEGRQHCQNDEDGPDSCVIACDVNYEDGELYCDDCGERIESAYAEPEEHQDYPHDPGYLIGCPACEERCHCGEEDGNRPQGRALCVWGGHDEHPENQD